MTQQVNTTETGKASHTPGELTVERHPGHARDERNVLIDTDGLRVAVVSVNGSPRGNSPIAEANAARLALAWNSHDDLLAACKKCAAMCDKYGTDDEMMEEIAAALNAAVKAVAKAGVA